MTQRRAPYWHLCAAVMAPWFLALALWLLASSAHAQASCTWTRSTFTATTGTAATACADFATWYSATTRPVVEVCALDEATASAVIRIDTAAGGNERLDNWTISNPSCVWTGEPDPPPDTPSDYLTGPELLAVLSGFGALGLLMHGFTVGRVFT